MSDGDPEESVLAVRARDAHRALAGLGATCATAESLTGGLIGAHLTAVPGASATYRGGVIAYATDVKATTLGVPEDLLAEHGAVHPDVAAHMARGVRRLMDADIGLAVTGVAGPEPQDGRPVGTVHAAAVTSEGVFAREFRFVGDRSGIRDRTVEGALTLLVSATNVAKDTRP